MNLPPIKHAAPTSDELGRLCALCSRNEWETILMRSQTIINAATTSLVDFEREATRLLGRRISLDRESLKNSGDEKL